MNVVKKFGALTRSLISAVSIPIKRMSGDYYELKKCAGTPTIFYWKHTMAASMTV
jgi:hypothetical protein